VKKENKVSERLYEYRILFNPGEENSAQNSYHYYNAYNAPQALDFHLKSLNKKSITAQTLRIEKLNPFSEKWEDESSILLSLYNNE
tara:strand:- start:3824 stop:4081 length:258 start_codon:yes stop_codon:yes gene_type:complete